MNKYYVLTLIALSSMAEARLVNLKHFIPSVVIDLKYATDDNFTHEVVYNSAEAYLEEKTATALAHAQLDLAQYNLAIKVWDAYRPLSAQRKFWELVPNEDYVANPEKGSRHNRGCAVDITLIDLATGQELIMPTEFDNFTQKAHRDCYEVSAQAIINRRVLESVMTYYGFVGLPTEWWHFDYVGKDLNNPYWQTCPVLDIEIEDIQE